MQDAHEVGKAGREGPASIEEDKPVSLRQEKARSPQLESVLQDPSETILQPRLSQKEGLLPVKSERYLKVIELIFDAFLREGNLSLRYILNDPGYILAAWRNRL